MGAVGGGGVNYINKPIYCISHNGAFLAQAEGDPQGMTVWGSEEIARQVVRDEAKRLDTLPSTFRICEFKFTGKVMEG